MWRGINTRLCSLQEMAKRVNNCIASWHEQQYKRFAAAGSKKINDHPTNSFKISCAQVEPLGNHLSYSSMYKISLGSLVVKLGAASWRQSTKYARLPSSISAVFGVRRRIFFSAVLPLLWRVLSLLQSVAKYLRLTLVFMWNSAPREEFNCYFSDLLASTNKIFILAGDLGAGLSFCEVFLMFPNFL